MQKLKKLYRANYAGENVVSQLILKDGNWNPEVEFVPNQIFNTHSTAQAVCLGNGESRRDFDLMWISRHRAGLLAKDKFQSYGCNALYRNFSPDFLVATGKEIIAEIANTDYCTDNIVYTTAEYLPKYPEKFYLVPQNISFDAGALAAYLACFDGHKKVFLLGYDQYDTPGPVNNIYKDTAGYLLSTDEQNGQFFGLTLQNVVQTYDDVEFIRVMPLSTWWQPIGLRPLLNFRQISYKEFIIEADIC
jgi:hypothetical protein